MSKKQIDGGELCVLTLKQAGIGDLFVLHGGHLDPIFQAALDHDVRLIDTRHEAAAGHAADAYARQTGRVSCALATAGPGFTNILTAVTQCYLDCVPVLFIVGGPPLRDAERWPLQGGIDQIAMAKPVTRWATQVTRTELIPHLIGQALREATNGQPGPVLVEIPIDVLFGRVAPDKAPVPETLIAGSRPAPEKAVIREIGEVLSRADRPAIICGGGILFSDATDTLREFVAASGIPVFTNSKARGALPPEHPLNAGAHTNIKVAEASGIGTPAVALMLGARFGMFTEPGMLGPGRIPDDSCTIIQVDVGARELGRIRHVHYPVIADCNAFLMALIDGTRDIAWPDWREWSSAVHDLTGWHSMAYESVADKTRALHPYKAVSEVVKSLPEDAVICADG
ncbi:MAG: thiamine pyrophosphate-binding protein, partial [Gammaproteobacteria bacterium]|nr:thiamine pyrophosphate-binding protein [Gammaproteobacteria bacterium]